MSGRSAREQQRRGEERRRRSDHDETRGHIIIIIIIISSTTLLSSADVNKYVLPSSVTTDWRSRQDLQRTTLTQLHVDAEKTIRLLRWIQHIQTLDDDESQGIYANTR